MSDKLILVVEDDEDVREYLVRALNLEGYETVKASNGQEALNVLAGCLARGATPCCIILDLMMPVMDGQTFIDTMEHDLKEKLGEIAIIVLSAKRRSEGLEVLPTTVKTISKPFDLDELYEAIEKLCG